MVTLSARDLSDLVQPGRVHRRVYTDPGIFSQEMRNIFRRTWIYVAHESELPEPGDYLASYVADQPVVIVRDRDRQLHVLFNRCAHKGAQVVPDGRGSAKQFRCGYHGWCYGLDGRLMQVPAPQAYTGTGVAKGSATHALQRVAAADTYRGFIFARLDARGPTLFEWLGPIRSSIDNLIDRSPSGEIEIAGGTLTYLHRCNWKMFVENVCDAYHPAAAHQSSWSGAREIRRTLAATAPAPMELQMLEPFGSSYEFFDAMGARAVPYGHADLGSTSSIHAGYQEIGGYRAALEKRYGVQKAAEVLGLNRNNSVVYPSLMLKAPVQIIRTIRPLAVDATLVQSKTFRLIGAPEELFERAVLYSSLVNSSAGIVGPDDHEAYRRLQAGLTATGSSDWVDMHRYLHEEHVTDEGIRSGPGTSDLVFRAQFAAWRDYMTVDIDGC
jgi:benzoate/toluate 1,2-dioxygenase subunit alpha